MPHLLLLLLLVLGMPHDACGRHWSRFIFSPAPLLAPPLPGRATRYDNYQGDETGQGGKGRGLAGLLSIAGSLQRTPAGRPASVA